MNIKIREPIVNGIFYPSEKKELAAYIKNLINESESLSGNAFAIISPHAGYSFSGRISAAAYKTVSERVLKRVVIISPVHRDPENAIFLTESTHFKTPLGQIGIDTEIIDEMIACSTNIVKNDIPHLEEHAVEVQIPFIQYLFPGVKIVPILLGKNILSNVKTLAKILSLTFKDRIDSTLFVVSSNLSSYKIQKRAEEDCNLLIKHIINKEWRRIIELSTEQRISACGSGCISSLLAFAPPELEVKVLMKGTSSSTENPDKVVSYGAISLMPCSIDTA